MKGRPSAGVLGAVFGALGVLPLLPIASGVAARLATVPRLPGAERLHGDVKPALYAEVFLFVLAAPLAAFFFGSLLPSILEAWSSPGRLSFEWVGVGFASGFFLAMRGLQPKIAILVGLAVAALVTIGVREYRRSWRVRRLFARRPRRAALRLALAGACLQLAHRSGLGTPRHLLDDLFSELVVAGAAVAIVAALLCHWFASRSDVSLRRLGDAAWVGFLGSALALRFPRAVPVLLAACLPCFLFATFRTRASLSRLATPAAVGLLALVCGWRILAPRVAWIDLFEDGHSLGTSQLYLSGARPFLETIPVHGWGADGGVDTFFFRRFGATLQVFETRRAIWSVAAFALLGATALAAFGATAWGALAFLLALDITQVPIERQALALAALACLLWAARTGRTSSGYFVAGAFAGWEALHSLEYGLIILIGGALGLLILPFLEPGARRGRVRKAAGAIGRFSLGALLAASPFLFLLARSGALGSFLRVSFLETPGWVSEAWNLPAVSLWKGIVWSDTLDRLFRSLSESSSIPSFGFLLLLAAAVAALLMRGRSGGFDGYDRAAFIASAIAAVGMRAALGRADGLHSQRYGFFVAIPAAWLLMRCWRSKRPGSALLLACAVAVFVRLHPLRALDQMLIKVQNAARRDRDEVGALAPRSGDLEIKSAQARDLWDFRRYLDSRLRPGETFFDFDNQPALYFFADREPPVRFTTVAQYEAPERQSEVVKALETKKPPLVVLAVGPYGSFDGVSNVERAPEVARYLETHYVPDRVSGAWSLARRRDD